MIETIEKIKARLERAGHTDAYIASYLRGYLANGKVRATTPAAEVPSEKGPAEEGRDHRQGK